MKLLRLNTWVCNKSWSNFLSVIAVSQMETDGARQTFPCFDEPAFKAEFNIKLRHTEDYKAVSNMPITTQEVNKVIIN